MYKVLLIFIILKVTLVIIITISNTQLLCTINSSMVIQSMLSKDNFVDKESTTFTSSIDKEDITLILNSLNPPM